MDYLWIIFPAIIGVMVVANLWARDKDRDGRWHRYDHRSARRRLPDGTWTYRPLTAEEAEEEFLDRAW